MLVKKDSLPEFYFIRQRDAERDRDVCYEDKFPLLTVAL